MDIQIHYATFLQRLSAAFIDRIFILIMLVGIFLLNSNLFFGTCLLLIFYDLIFYFIYSATPGKLSLSLRIVDSKTFQKPTKWQFVIRSLIGYWAYLFLGNIAILLLIINLTCFIFTKQKQTLYDIIAGTVVIQDKVLKIRSIKLSRYSRVSKF